jgi:hypothetical protein
MPRQSGHFKRALKLYAGRGERDLSDIRGPLIEGMIGIPIKQVAELLQPGEIAAILSRYVQVDEELACEEVFSRRPGVRLQRRLDELKEMLLFPLRAPTSSAAFIFVEQLSRWNGGELYQQVAWILLEKQLPHLERMYLLN